ncbi:MAG: pknB, partial [Friedmanniella sp.]|nr:pknB [Friedmanniella sp.]
PPTGIGAHDGAAAAGEAGEGAAYDDDDTEVRPRGSPVVGSRPVPSRRTLVIVAAAAVLVLATVLGIYGLTAGRTQLVSVPDVVGATRADAERSLLAVGLTPRFKNVAGPAGRPLGTVLAQTPKNGVSVAPTTVVLAQVNVGPANATIPDGLVGRQVDRAKAVLADAGFTSVSVQAAQDDPVGARPGQVLAVDPGEGKPAALAQDVVLTVAGLTDTATTPPRSAASRKLAAGVSSSAQVPGARRTTAAGPVPSSSPAGGASSGGASVGGAGTPTASGAGSPLVTVPPVGGSAGPTTEVTTTVPDPAPTTTAPGKGPDPTKTPKPDNTHKPTKSPKPTKTPRPDRAAATSRASQTAPPAANGTPAPGAVTEPSAPVLT